MSNLEELSKYHPYVSYKEFQYQPSRTSLSESIGGIIGGLVLLVDAIAVVLFIAGCVSLL